MKVVVAGSGLAGVFAALGCLERGLDVLMIDPGKSLDQSILNLKQELSRVTYKEWTDVQLDLIKYGVERAAPSLLEKRLFGSAFAIEGDSEQKSTAGCKILHSNAVGGLSNLWGRGIEPPYEGEFEHWPRSAEFKQALNRVLEWIPLAAERDNLAEVMPLYTDQFSPHRITDGATALLEHWERNRENLNLAGIHFGKTRLALKDCRYCGLCFFGCVYDAMFDSTSILSRLMKFDNFQYRSGVVLGRYQDGIDGVLLTLKTAEGKEESLFAQDLILAAGGATTTEIVMSSAKIQSLIIKNSELLKIAFISLKKKQTDKEHHSLSQLTLTIKQKKLTKKAIVIHLFGRNILIEEVVQRITPRFIHKLLSNLLAHTFVGMCFLHSDDSSVINVKHCKGRFVFKGGSVFGAWVIYVKLLIYLVKHIKKLGLLPIPFIGGVALPGSSVHTGASLATNPNGRLINHHHVFAADASTLPEIPAGSFTLSIMANAYLMGSSVGKR